MNRTSRTLPLFFSAAMYSLFGGYVHLREWLNGYRLIPSRVPGSWVVRDGFILNAAVSVVLVGALVLAATKLPKLTVPALLGNAAFQVGSLGILIATRVGSVFGWAEPVWTQGADQARAAEIGALVMLGLTGLLYFRTRPVVAPAA